MPITPTYPGVYIEELPSTARTITPSPTSITVFTGYTHPFKTRRFNEAVQIFSYADYEREFGGIFQSGAVDVNVAYAVNDFFLNGGSNAYVVGLPAIYRDVNGLPVGATETIGGALVLARAADTDTGIKFTAREPTDLAPIKVETVWKDAANLLIDVVVTHGRRAESFRNVSLDPSKADFIEARLGTDINPISELVTVQPDPSYPTLATFLTKPALPPPTTSVLLQDLPPVSFSGSFAVSDFADVFAQDASLDKVSVFNLMAIPGIASEPIWSAALAFCERKMAFLLLDPPPDAVATPGGLRPAIEDIFDNGVGPVIPKSPNGALYFPFLLARDPLTGDVTERPPSGHVAGMYAKSDLRRGVWKAPAGLETTLLNASGPVPDGRMTDMRHGVLNTKGVNVLRAFPGTGTVIFGARTLVAQNPAFQQWRYVSVRRMALFVEQTLYANLNWVVFEPNDEPLWVAIRTTIDAFMLGLFNQGAFQGRTPSQAFLVQCDSTTTTQADIDNGIVNITVGFRPLKPAEFVIVKITQLAGQT